MIPKISSLSFYLKNNKCDSYKRVVLFENKAFFNEFGVLRFKLKPKQNYETALKLNQLNTILFDTIW